MILPASSGAILFLCLLVFLSWGCWILPWRLSARRLRFEIFAADFAVGSFLCALLAAFTLGSMGSELAFTDSLMVSGHRAQAALLAGGVLAGLANVALIASSSLAGVSIAFPVTVAVLALVFGWTSGLHHVTHLALGSVLCLASLVALAVASRMPVSVQPPGRTKQGGKTPRNADFSLRGIGLAVLSGILLAPSAALARYGTSGEIGVAPYPAFAFITAAALVPTFFAVFFLFNFPLQGQRLHAAAYFGASIAQHATGLLAGVIWGAGLLGCFLLRNAPAEAIGTGSLPVYASLGSFLLAMLLGVLVLKDPESTRSRTGLFALAAGLLALGLYALGYAVTH